jgi:hypothetical protein
MFSCIGGEVLQALDSFDLLEVNLPALHMPIDQHAWKHSLNVAPIV